MKDTEFRALVDEWLAADEDRRAAIAREAELRKQVAEAIPKTKEEGVDTRIVGKVEVKATRVLNRTIDHTMTDAVLPEAPTLAETVFVQKMSLDMKGYRKLDGKLKRLADSCITVTPGAPKVTVRPVEEK